MPPTLADAIGTTPGRYATSIAHLKRLLMPPQVQFSIQPSRGTSRLRDQITTTGTGAQVVADGGELKISSGSDGTGEVTLRTRERGQYRSGNWGQGSLAVRIPNLPTGSQVVRWGYFGVNHGFGWGVDADGPFTFRRVAGTDTLRRRADWNQDALDGTGPSRVTLDLSTGAVFCNLFRHYGHGPLIWYYEPKVIQSHQTPEVDVDRRVYEGELNVVDPNQPVSVEVENGGTASNLDVFVGGRQYSLLGHSSAFEQRTVPALRRSYTVSAADTWEPIMAVRKRPTFGPTTDENTVRAVVEEISAIVSAQAELRLTFDATVSGITWKDPEGYSGTGETATQQNDGGFTVDADGLPLIHTMVSSAPNRRGVVEEENRVSIGDGVVVLWVRSTTTPTVDVANVLVQEQW